MGILGNLIGPISKYDKSLPYTYEARVLIIEGEEEHNTYLSDTICGLIKYLEKNKLKPKEVEIYEIFQKEENLIQTDFYTSKEGDWLKRPELCQLFQEHYAGHIYEGGCSFEDRDCNGIGP
jgi:hypothetical protein